MLKTISIICALSWLTAGATVFKPDVSDQLALDNMLPLSSDMLQLQQALQHSSDDNQRLQLAHLYLSGARRPGFDAWFHQAEQLLALVSEDSRQSLQYLLLQADIQQQQHQFNAALQTLNKVLLQQPQHIQASLMEARVHLALKQPDSAQQACGRLWQQDLFLFSVCSYEVAGRRGNWQQSYAALLQLWQRQQSLPAELDIWLRGILAEQAEQLGLVATAKQWLTPVLVQAPTSLWIKWSDLSLALGQPESVYQQLNLLASDYALADSLLLRLARAEKQLSKAPVFTTQLQQRMQLRLLRGDTEHAADLVHYFLHISPEASTALYWAERNYQSAKEPDDEYLLHLSRHKVEQQAGVSE